MPGMRKRKPGRKEGIELHNKKLWSRWMVKEKEKIHGFIVILEIKMIEKKLNLKNRPQKKKEIIKN